MITLDIPTVLLLYQSSLLVGAVVFLLARRQRKTALGFGTLASAFALLGCGSALAGLGEYALLPKAVWTLLTLTFGLYGHGLLVVGIERLRTGRPPRHWRLLAVYPVPFWIVAWITGYHEDNQLRAIVFHLNAALCLIWAARIVDRLRRMERLPSCLPLETVLALGGLSFAFGAGAILFVRDFVPWLAVEFSVQILGNFAIAVLIYSVAIDRAERKLSLMADLDSLTGVGNRRFLEKTVPKRLYPGDTVLYIDLDHFKRLNDRFGHATGDAVLVAVAGALREGKRPDDLLARLGGEEFLVFLSELKTSEALSIAERLREAIQGLQLHHQGTGIPVTASIGVAQVKRPDEEWLDLVHAADTALYAAKHEGRNRVALASSRSQDAMPA